LRFPRCVRSGEFALSHMQAGRHLQLIENKVLVFQSDAAPSAKRRTSSLRCDFGKPEESFIESKARALRIAAVERAKGPLPFQRGRRI
jgi:hypothetical protein